MTPNNKKQNIPKSRRNNHKKMRGAAQRASRRNFETATKVMDIHNVKEVEESKRANIVPISGNDVLRFIPLGGQDGIGEKNMQVFEYGNSAIIVDCGMDLSVDLPGVNFAIPDASYLDSIKHKIKGYVITHGHLDHIGGLPYVVPKYPAPIYGSHFTTGMVRKIFDDRERGIDQNFQPELVEMNMDNHEKLKLGDFTIELIRMTHSIPDSSAIAITTPVGKIIQSGDFRLDPEPLDHMPSDIARLEELGKDNVLMLMSDSTNAQRLGRTPTEHTLQPSFTDLIKHAPGRVIVSIFSSNINRIQMIINAAVQSGRQVAIDGRSMLSTVSLAVQMGQVKVPKGTITRLKSMPHLPDEKVLVVCTGGQGEINASLQRMSIGTHNHIKLKAGDTVIISSTPIPGNEVRYDQISDDLIRNGVHLYRAPTHEIDGSGPLHVSGHAARDEQVDLIRYTTPQYFVPIYAGPLHRKYHVENAIANANFERKKTFMVDNGQTLEFRANKTPQMGPKVPIGSILIDNTGSVVTSVVVKDRLVMSEDGIVSVMLTIDKTTGQLLSSADIITRGFIYIRDNEELMQKLRQEVRFLVMRKFKQLKLDDFKQELRDHIQHVLFKQTNRSPMIIPVVNVVDPTKPYQPPQPVVADTSHE